MATPLFPMRPQGVIHRVVLRETDGLRVTATRAPDEAGTEFLVSRRSGIPAHAGGLRTSMAGSTSPISARAVRAAGFTGWFRKDFRSHHPRNSTRPRPPCWPPCSATPMGGIGKPSTRLLIEQQDPAALPLLSNALVNAKLSLARLGALNLLGAGEPSRNRNRLPPCATETNACAPRP